METSSTSTNSSFCNVYNALTATIEHEKLPIDKIISGDVTTGATDLGENAQLTTGIWEHSVGISIDIEVDEVFVILSGKGRIYVNDQVLELYPGAVGTLSAGARTRWEIDETIRKVYVFPREYYIL